MKNRNEVEQYKNLPGCEATTGKQITRPRNVIAELSQHLIVLNELLQIINRIKITPAAIEWTTQDATRFYFVLAHVRNVPGLNRDQPFVMMLFLRQSMLRKLNRTPEDDEMRQKVFAVFQRLRNNILHSLSQKHTNQSL